LVRFAQPEAAAVLRIASLADGAVKRFAKGFVTEVDNFP
jgi:hypothetical protein